MQFKDFRLKLIFGNMKLVFASSNRNKIAEIRAMIPNTIGLLGLDDIGCTEDIPETADTIEGNAILKADYVTKNYGYNCFADDSGLEVNSLDGAPGVHSARFAGPQRSDKGNIDKLLKELEGRDDRSAQFKTVIALNIDGAVKLFTGIARGKIISESRGLNGFGYDPVFIGEGMERTFAELSPKEKAAVSHRGKAVRELIEFLSS